MDTPKEKVKVKESNTMLSNIRARLLKLKKKRIHTRSESTYITHCSWLLGELTELKRTIKRNTKDIDKETIQGRLILGTLEQFLPLLETKTNSELKNVVQGFLNKINTQLKR